MFTIVIAITVAVLGGAGAGAVAGWWTARRQSGSAAFDDLGFDPDLDEKITQAARQWAVRQGEPDAAPFVANKLRLVHVLKRGRSRRRWRRSR
jgi:hypothetical protein